MLASKYNSAMRKYFFVVVPLLFWGCEKTFDTVIDTSTDNYQVSSIAGIKDTVDLKVPGDSLLNIRLIFAPGSHVEQAYFDIYASDNSKLNSSPIYMQEIITNIFENSFILEKENPLGNYTVRFFASGNSGSTQQVALRTFFFNNGQDNISPVISNTVIEPDTVVVTQPTVIFTSVEASDSNGVNDLVEVYFIVYRPDSTTSNNKTILLDDGSCCPIPPSNLTSGDLIAGDGIFSRTIQVDQTNMKGTYRFEFQAKDRSGTLSNIINHYVLIQ
jgi:hypothetical protein